MRPTFLQFRRPSEINNKYYDPTVTYTGNKLNFQPHKQTEAGIQEKTLSFNSSEPRFPQYRVNSLVTQAFLGPGSYNDDISFKQLAKQPTAIKYKDNILKQESKRNCYTMIENNLSFTPAFEKPSEKKKRLNAVEDQDSLVNLNKLFN